MVTYNSDELVLTVGTKQYVVTTALEVERSTTPPNELEIRTIWPSEQIVDDEGMVILLSLNPNLRNKIAVEIEKLFYSVDSGLYDAVDEYWTFVYGDGKS